MPATSGASIDRCFGSGGLACVAGRAAARANLQRIRPHRLGDVLEQRRTEIGHSEIEPPLDLSIGVLGKTDRARVGDAFQPRCNVDAVAHQVAVALFDDVSQVNAYAELDALIGRHADIALDHRVLNGDGAMHRFDYAAELDQHPVAGALEHPAVLAGDSGIDEVGPQGPQSCERPILVRARHAAESDDIGGENRRYFPGLGHASPDMDGNSTRWRPLPAPEKS
jgi:hypothetical protein